MTTPTIVGAGAESVSLTQNLVSVLIPCCGMLEYTKLCVPSLLRHSRPPFELIFLDIGALDGTAAYLEGLRAGAVGTRIEVVRTPTDLGIAEACRAALGLVRGDYLVLLNNDTIVPEGWLHQLVGLATLSPALGLVGPMSNYAAPPQLEEDIPYRFGPFKKRPAVGPVPPLAEPEAIHRFAREHRERHRGKWLETDRLGGFCLLLKRAVLDRIGLLDPGKAGGIRPPEADLGLFDTDILSAKARQAGFTLAVCRDLFVHHFGTRTFAHAPGATSG